ncbi:hepatic lectin-like isoform X2 [Rhinatrema bivittatum]|uniref:hepatic lectin-like isoform X2 n=1 Tax=Rhinatrema bivittatum TaxID=194408 RepID=UPI001125F5A1|nr:hepatic lectin-like isoform X2 [Rhinatrema bivittatum]
MDSDIVVGHRRLEDELMIHTERGRPPSKVRSLYLMYALLAVAFLFILILFVVSFSRAPKESPAITVRANESTPELMALQSKVAMLSSQFVEMKGILQKNAKESLCGYLSTDWEAFGGHCYFFYQSELNWMDAKAMCEALNSTLAVINSAQEQYFISSRCKNERYWIGLHDVNKEGDWEWIDGTDYNTSYKFWQENEPNDYHCNEDCVHVWLKGEWNDVHCTDECYAICETAVPVSLTPAASEQAGVH